MNVETLRPVVQKALEEMWAQYAASNRITLNAPSWDAEEILEAMDSLLSGQLTMGKKVAAFEKKFASYVGAPGAVMVNSGSSANLLAMMLLTNPETPDHLRPGSEVITPAVTWSTTVFPILAAGLTPVLIDVDPETLVVDSSAVEEAITERTGAIFPVHLLGNPCDVKVLSEIAQEHSLFLVEDSCEAHGAQLDGGRVAGSFGNLSTFSFFFSHHITTIEGGTVLAKDQRDLDTLRSLRAHGWIRERADRKRIENAFPQLDPRFLFVNMGFNLRPTEIQGAFGLHQLDKLEKLIDIRRKNAKFLTERLGTFEEVLQLPRERPGTRHVYFGYPIVVKEGAPFKASDLQQYLDAKGVETRPIMSGNIARHPAMKLFQYRQAGPLPNADRIAENGFFFGIHHGTQPEDLERIVDSFADFMKQRGITRR